MTEWNDQIVFFFFQGKQYAKQYQVKDNNM